MKAVVHRDFGSADALKIEEIPKPKPAEGEVLIRVRAASLNPLDMHLLHGKPALFRVALGLRKPKRIGRDLAGVVESIGPAVKRFKAGDEVFGVAKGSLAEFATTLESRLAPKPPGITFEAAASIPIAGVTALQGLRDIGKLKAGQHVLINGAAGGVGTFAVPLAKYLGATVTAVCSDRNVELVRSLGADRVIDYTREDFTKIGDHYDLIFDMIGNHSFSKLRPVLKPNGIIVVIGGGGPGGQHFGSWLLRAVVDSWRSKFTSQKMTFMLGKIVAEDLSLIAGLIEQKKLKPVIDSRYELAETREAMRVLQSGHTRGKLVVSI